MACTKDVHADCDPDQCFAAKCAYWRKTGDSFGVTFQGGRQQFHSEPSVKQQERDQVALMKSQGINFDRPPS